MPHPLVDQLRFARLQWLRALDGVPEEDALRRLEPMNSIGWLATHLAWHEQLYWLTRAQGQTREPQLNELAASGGPASTPPLGGSLEVWRRVTAAADPYLDGLSIADLGRGVTVDGKPWPATQGSWLHRMTYHYWFHTGEVMAIRQMLGHPDLPEFVGDLDTLAPYRAEEA
ncbi:hypothetical protein BH23CHL8_BH23CHL8_28630 [soil metagenome]